MPNTDNLNSLSSYGGEGQGERWRLNAIQWDFIASPARFCCFVGGIGSGKTFAGAVRAITQGVEQPRSLGLIGAPTYPMLRDASQRTYFELLPTALVHDFNKSEGHLRLTNGAEVLFRSLDAPDRVRGLNLAWF
jgi:phage terminase large subunit-like protein